MHYPRTFATWRSTLNHLFQTNPSAKEVSSSIFPVSHDLGFKPQSCFCCRWSNLCTLVTVGIMYAFLGISLATQDYINPSIDIIKKKGVVSNHHVNNWITVFLTKLLCFLSIIAFIWVYECYFARYDQLCSRVIYHHELDFLRRFRHRYLHSRPASRVLLFHYLK